MLAIRLPKSLEKRLAVLAKKTGRTKTSYGREAVLEHISDMEDLNRAHSIKQRIDHAQERIHTLDEAIRKLGFKKKELQRRKVHTLR